MSRAADAQLAIQNLLACLAQLADSGDVDAYVALMTDDVVWDLPANPAVGLAASRRTGRDEIAGGARERLAAGLQGPGTNTMHVLNTIVIELDDGDDAATARSHFVFLENMHAGPTIRTAGRYVDVVRRGDDGWKLASRTITFG